MKVIVKNIATEYKDEGSGPTLVFLHGWKDDLRTFDSISNQLSKSWRVVRLDLPGFGNSEPTISPWDLSGYAAFLNDFMGKVDIQPDALLGHSFGGRILIKGISQGILNPKKVILINSAGIANSKNVQKTFIKVLTKIGGFLTYIPPFIFWREKIKKNFYDQIGSDYLGAGRLRETYLKIIKEDLGLAAKGISVPTLLIWGRNDTETPLSDGQKFSELISGSILKVIDDAGHFVHQEKPDEVVQIIKEFL